MRRPFMITALALVLGLLSSGSDAQMPSGTSRTISAATDDIAMDDYLGLLAQISPAAREGAQYYRQAYQQRCGRPLTTQELRHAVSDGNGDPVLMAMVRASHPNQQAPREATLLQLAQRIRCDPRSGP